VPNGTLGMAVATMCGAETQARAEAENAAYKAGQDNANDQLKKGPFDLR